MEVKFETKKLVELHYLKKYALH